jgi:hypothetical protein
MTFLKSTASDGAALVALTLFLGMAFVVCAILTGSA